MKISIVPLVVCPGLITISAELANSAGRQHRSTLNHVSQAEKLTETCQRAATLGRMRALLLASVCAIAVGSCATPPTVEVVTISPGEVYRSPAQTYQLSERERRTCEAKASQGDILAAKKLVEYHMMVTSDDKQVRHWLRVVDRLQKARLQKARFATRSSLTLPQ